MPAKFNKHVVIRDTREKSGHGWIFEPSTRCAGTVERTLLTGDYSLEGYYHNDLLAIERKGSVAEFAGNLTSPAKWDDFRRELERLDKFRWPFIVLEFSAELIQTFPVGSGIPRHLWKRLRARSGFLAKRVAEIELAYKANVVYAGSAEAAKAWVSCLFKRVVEAVPKP